jgi:putative endonuclease
MFYVYVLESLKDEKFYTGFTEDIKRRIDEHNSGENISTARRRPLKLVYYEAFCDKNDALRRERYFKSTKGKTTLRQMLRNYLAAKTQGN